MLKNTKFKILIVISAVAVVSCLGINAFAFNNSHDSLFKYGHLYKNNLENKTTDLLNKREALYWEAVSLGYMATDEEVEAALKQEKENAKQAVNYDEFLVFLDGAQMTEDEYWDSTFNSKKKDLIIAKYVNELKEKYQ